ncbi:Hypothetical protein PP7435_CHR1-1436 [Komagataella phaffii CBS 7435]|uniref:Uncharacterized protein n=2 Tax=Komagataella phaffii TaxID=460519 RepID=C4QZ11_KOMPG|nr:Hypothetical protein PAS_chr1-4_0625 [Komagataella phaffii GS115]AOA60433.1 GQ67_01512T0 [Komagataella phaffii]CAH2447312.1 Hypothetical protein BQ9382_C1-7505 [Komagataella phaffii CBS 7435]AOA66135.1 GQ68_01528T0 [Komagataella phaffii GS115]CAY68485.1 Hypothetical protein PAS_chr1-4_0625 [Komagataella phaffii GS115]CCA37550.1 Hypothetical protein PP7435_CHR1-1436 [Komagataella phaffii CBS 7435]
MLTIVPNKSVGNFQLGSSITQITKILQREKEFNNTNFIFSQSQPNRLPIVIELENRGIRLTFDPFGQKLILIQILMNKTKQRYQFKGKVLPEDLYFKEVYNRIFGPTYPGTIYNPSSENNSEGHDGEESQKQCQLGPQYTLSYEGICFQFNLSPELSQKLTSSDDNEVAIQNVDEPLLCQGINIFQGKTWAEYLEGTAFMLRQKLTEELLTQEIAKLSSGFSIIYALIGPGEVEFKLSQHPRGLSSFKIVLTKTEMSAVVETFGPPDDSVLKEDKDQWKKIHNYFRYGFDVFYDVGKPLAPVQKIVIHNNVVTSYEFLKYEKLTWFMYNQVNQQLICDCHTEKHNLPFRYDSANDGDQIYHDHTHSDHNHQAKLGGYQNNHASLNQIKKKDHIILNRKEYGLDFSDQNSSRFELVDYDDQLECQMNSNMEPTGNDWGLSKLFGYNRYVFEILVDSGVMSSITLF